MAFNAVFMQVGKECLQTRAQTVVKIFTYASTNKYNITYTCYAWQCYAWQSRISFLQLHTELKHVYSKRFVQVERLSTRAQYNNQYRIPTQSVIA